MRLIVGLLVAVLFVATCRKAIKRVPGVFYAAAIVLVALHLYGTAYGLPVWLWKTVMFLLQKNILAFSLFVIVMFLGVLSDGSWLKRALLPIRGELSIIACILSLGHVIVFGTAYLERMAFARDLLSPFGFLAVAAAVCVVALMVPLFVTSFKIVRSRMAARSWKIVQVFAYPFFLLLFVHLALFVGPSALQGGWDPRFAMATYGFLLLAYVTLRVRKGMRDRKGHREMEGA